MIKIISKCHISKAALKAWVVGNIFSQLFEPGFHYIESALRVSYSITLTFLAQYIG